MSNYIDLGITGFQLTGKNRTHRRRNRSTYTKRGQHYLQQPYGLKTTLTTPNYTQRKETIQWGQDRQKDKELQKELQKAFKREALNIERDEKLQEELQRAFKQKPININRDKETQKRIQEAFETTNTTLEYKPKKQKITWGQDRQKEEGERKDLRNMLDQQFYTTTDKTLKDVIERKIMQRQMKKAAQGRKQKQQALIIKEEKEKEKEKNILLSHLFENEWTTEKGKDKERMKEIKDKLYKAPSMITQKAIETYDNAKERTGYNKLKEYTEKRDAIKAIKQDYTLSTNERNKLLYEAKTQNSHEIRENHFETLNKKEEEPETKTRKKPPTKEEKEIANEIKERTETLKN